MEKYGKDLIFISQINRDGSGTNTNISQEYIEMMQNDVFKVFHLSLSEKTFIAIEFNSFVVKLKETS
jgi:hypothetical protein